MKIKIKLKKFDNMIKLIQFRNDSLELMNLYFKSIYS
jgi:hypothetical protein